MRLKKYRWILLSSLTIIMPLIHLRLTRGYWNPDWLNHIWPIGYAGVYFKHHLSLPVMTSDSVFLNYPVSVFYAYLLYPLCGVMSSLIGPDLALRVPIVVAMVLQFLLAYRLISNLTGNKFWSWTFATLITWAIYPLTNIYHRAGVPEFVAGAFIHCVCLAWILALISKRRAEMIFYVFFSAFSLMMVIGTHPISAVYAIPVLILILLASLPQLGKMPSHYLKALVLSVAGSSVFIFLVAAPWIFITQLFLKKLSIALNPGVYFYPNSMDNFWVRFGLLPVDRRSLELGIKIDTPYLDAQINMPLLILILGILFLGRGKFFAGAKSQLAVFGRNLFYASVTGFFIFTVMSLNPGIYNHLPEIFKQVQMAYRLVNFQNVSLLIAFISLCLANGKFFAEVKSSNLIVLTTICLTISFCGLADKHGRIRAVFMERHPSGNSELFQTMRPRFPIWNYTAIDMENLDPAIPLAKDVITFPLDPGKDFGAIGPIDLSVQTSGWYKTNVAAFEWNRIFENESEIPPAQYRETDYRLAIHLEPGAHHLRTKAVPHPLWLKLRTVSFFTFALSLLVCLIQFAYLKFYMHREFKAYSWL